MTCTEKGCSKEATHLLATRRGRVNYITFNFKHYREVCKKHGKQHSLNGYHLMESRKK